MYVTICYILRQAEPLLYQFETKFGHFFPKLSGHTDRQPTNELRIKGTRQNLKLIGEQSFTRKITQGTVFKTLHNQ
jgi:hypothetical protein